jgi:hypothetical protein
LILHRYPESLPFKFGHLAVLDNYNLSWQLHFLPAHPHIADAIVMLESWRDLCQLRCHRTHSSTQTSPKCSATNSTEYLPHHHPGSRVSIPNGRPAPTHAALHVVIGVHPHPHPFPQRTSSQGQHSRSPFQRQASSVTLKIYRSSAPMRMAHLPLAL